RLVAVDHGLVQRLDQAFGRAAAGALIDAAGIGEAVADDPATLVEGGPNRPFQVVGSRGVHQQGLGARRPAVGLSRDGNTANLLGARRSARLTRLEHVDAEGAQALDQQARLGRLAGPLAAFESNESASLHLRTMAGGAAEASPF